MAMVGPIKTTASWLYSTSTTLKTEGCAVYTNAAAMPASYLINLDAGLVFCSLNHLLEMVY